MTESDLIGRRIHGFEILRPIGAGGMGRVFLARQLSLNRDVAFKIIREESTADPIARERFRREAEVVARLSHPNVVQVYEFGEEDGIRYMALEYVEGRNLLEFVERKGIPETKVAVTILRRIAAALRRAAELGVVHRDIKPENILITKRLETKVTDFGLSLEQTKAATNLTQNGYTVGSPCYMAPEQVRAQLADHRTDLYSFGGTAYFLLTGRPPFTGPSPIEIASKHLTETPEPLEQLRPDLPDSLRQLIHKMLAKSPDDRPTSAAEVAAELKRIAQSLGDEDSIEIDSVELPVSPPQQLPSRPFPWRLVAASAMLVVLGAFLGNRGRARSELPPESGLPASRLPEMFVSARELELAAKRESRSAKPQELLEASIELGLLRIREQRYMEAETVFRELEQERFGGPKSGAVTAARLGRAIILARQDHPRESAEMIEKATFHNEATVDRLFKAHPDFGRAVADAQDRNAANLDLPFPVKSRRG